MGYLDDRRNQKIFGKPPAEKKRYFINKISKKRALQMKEDGRCGDEKMDDFFNYCRTKMKCRCFFCNGKTEKDNDDTFIRSIAHLLPKAIFKSVALCEFNWIELCFFGNSCHTNFDNGTITWEFIKDSKEWEVIKEKLLIVLPLVAQEERKHKLYSKLINLVYAADKI